MELVLQVQYWTQACWYIDLDTKLLPDTTTTTNYYYTTTITNYYYYWPVIKYTSLISTSSFEYKHISRCCSIFVKLFLHVLGRDEYPAICVRQNFVSNVLLDNRQIMYDTKSQEINTCALLRY